MDRLSIFVMLMLVRDLLVLDRFIFDMLMLDVQGLGDRLGGGKDRFVLRKCCGQGSCGLGGNFRLDVSNCLSHRRLRRGRWLRIALVLRNRLSGQ
ncbi:MAG TPA: hypothetical protein VKA15_06655 [Isosphaeraceae bacterium]|nr:hypothetical protein [Isosphaeraceae bacterium]